MRVDRAFSKTRDWPLRAPLLVSPLPLLLLLLVLLLLLTGCGKGSPPADIVPIVKFLMASAALSAARTKAAAAAKHYMERRVLYLTGKNSGWATESGFTSLVARLGSEMNQVAAFVDERLTTLGGSDPVTPAHRDLQDAAKHLTTDGPSAIATQFQKNQRERAERIAQIAWRGCAIQPEVWAGGDSTLAPTLQKPGLTEVLDRRLHAVEVLILHDEVKPIKWTVTASNSGWKDQQRTSMFQYPWARFEDGADFQAALAAAGLTVPGLAPDWISDGHEIDFKLQTRVRPETSTDWVWDQPNYFLSLAAGATGATALEHMIPLAPKVDPVFEDFWERNWMFCDIMLAALHLHGIRFSRLRRTGSDSDFNTAAAAGVTLRPVIPTVGPPATNVLMSNGAQWFEGVAIPHDDLQVGDHLIYWNNQFVRHILGSAFGLENSYVTRINSDGYAVMLAGHGMVETTETKFAEEMAEEMAGVYKFLRKGINDKFAADPSFVRLRVTIKTISFQLLRWEPFGEICEPEDSTVELRAKGAWWIRLKLTQLHDFNQPPPSMTDALAMLPKSIRVDLSRGMHKPPLEPGDFQSDYQESLYLPMSVPAGVRNGWPTYLATPTPGEALGLVDLIPDGSMVPGFFLKGRNQQSTIPVLRPKVRN